MVNQSHRVKRSVAVEMNNNAATTTVVVEDVPKPLKIAKLTTTNNKDTENAENAEYTITLIANKATIRYEVHVPAVDPKMKPTNCLWTIHGLSKPSKQQRLTKSSSRAKEQEEYNKQEFYLFMSERQRIFVRRQRGDKCWSASPIFQNFAWCNVYRELDRGTQYFRAFVLSIPTHYNDRQRLQKILFASYLYRLVNRIESFQATGFPDVSNVNAYLKKVIELQKSGHKFFTGAHQTTNFASYAIYVKDVAKRLDTIVRHIGAAQTTEVLCILLQEHLPGVGPFMAWQIQCDLKEAKAVSHLKGGDGDMFCVLGPGAKSGIAAIFGQTKRRKEEYLELAQSLMKSQDDYYNKLGLEFPYWNGRKLSIKEIEHALCEYAKFKKVSQTSTGRRYHSRSGLDDDQCCVKCSANGDDLFLCDTCNQAMCQKCVPTVPDGLFWTCPLCDALEARW